MAYTGNETTALMLVHLNTVSTGGNWDSGDLLNLANVALKKVARIVPSDLRGPLAQKTTLNVVAVSSPNIPTIAFPSGVKIYQFTGMSLGQIPADQIPIMQLYARFNQQAKRPFGSSTPPADETHYYAADDAFYFFPRYTSNQSYVFRYVKEPTALTATGTMDIHDALCDTVVLLATRMALQQDGRLEAAVVIDKNLDDEINSLAKTHDIDTKEFAFPMMPGQAAKRETG